MSVCCVRRWICLTAIVAAAGGLVVGTSCPAAEATDALSRLAAAEAGGGHADLATIADHLAAAAATELRPALQALEAATPTGSNWLRSGLDRAVERLGTELSSDELAAWATDQTPSPSAASFTTSTPAGSRR